MFVPLPDFMTSARRELIPSADFLAFLVGAIVACEDRDDLRCVVQLRRSGRRR